MVKMSRDGYITKEQILMGYDKKDRKIVGYNGFYERMLKLIQSMRAPEHKATYERYLRMTRSWVKAMGRWYRRGRAKAKSTLLSSHRLLDSVSYV